MIDLEALELELETPATARQGILGCLDINAWLSQFVNFLDLIVFQLQHWLFRESVVLATADIG
jgi:hypothetical protein